MPLKSHGLCSTPYSLIAPNSPGAFMRIWFRLAAAFITLVLSCAAIGCGGGGGGSGTGMPPVNPISVSLSSSTVIVPEDGMPASIQLTINSTSETALVSFAPAA